MIELLLVAEQFIDDGALDRAEHLYEQVAEADPRNAIAVVGLARVALARGDRERALAEARRALVIDPEEVAAQRLIAHLQFAAAGTRSDAMGPDQDQDSGPVEALLRAESEAEVRAGAEAAFAAEAEPAAWSVAPAPAALPEPAASRSEERRVGKECRL